MSFIGIPELLIILAIVLLVLGPKRLPGLGRSLGGGIRNFKDAIKGGERRRELPDAAEEPDARAEDRGLDGEVVRDERR